jgi:hypothetical protein
MGCCNNTIVCSNLTTTDTGVILLPNRAIKNVTNLSEYRLICACNIPKASANLPVYIQTDLGNIPVLCKYGNTVYANQINTRVNYPILYGDGNENYTLGQFVIASCSCLNKKSTTEEAGG